MNEKMLKKLIVQDRPGAPDPYLRERLRQVLFKRSAVYKIRQNSFAGFFSWIFSSRQAAIKLAFAGIVTFLFFVKPDFIFYRHVPSVIDTTRVDQSGATDSALFHLPKSSTTDSIL